MSFFQILKFTFLLPMIARRQVADASNNGKSLRSWKEGGVKSIWSVGKEIRLIRLVLILTP